MGVGAFAYASGAHASGAHASGAEGATPAVLRFATGPDYRPFTDPDLPEGGMATEILVKAFARVGMTAAVDFMPWSRARRLAADHVHAGAFPYIESQARARRFLFSDPITVSDRVAFVRADADIAAAHPAELPGGSFCYPEGYAVYESLRARMAKGDLARRKPRDMKTCFESLAKGEVDFVPAPRWQGWRTAEAVLNARGAVKVLDVVFTRIGNHLMVARDHPRGAQIIARFNKGLAALKADGTYQNILKRHLGEDLTRGAPRDPPRDPGS